MFIYRFSWSQQERWKSGYGKPVVIPAKDARRTMLDFSSISPRIRSGVVDAVLRQYLKLDELTFP